jgi:twitching motility protein PilT
MSLGIDDLLRMACDRKASDLHLKVGNYPYVRVNGELVPLIETKRLTAEDTLGIALGMMTNRQKQKFKENAELDMAYGVAGLGRFRCNFFQQRGSIAVVLRVIPTHIFTIDELQLPRVLEKICQERRGLVLVTGTTGSGKSTSLAAIIDHINSNRTEHIITIEDPIEFLHRDKKAFVSQREVEVDTKSFGEALRSALRQDPDVILVGEMRDLETIQIAVTAAEMGILVMGTLHTNGAAQTVDRVINVFPSDKQSHVRTMLSTSLRGVVSQQLLQRADKQGRVAALEIMVNNAAVGNLIRQGNLDQLENTMQSGASTGMRTMDGSIQALFDQRVITGKEAYKKAINKGRFEAFKDSG